MKKRNMLKQAITSIKRLIRLALGTNVAKRLHRLNRCSSYNTVVLPIDQLIYPNRLDIQLRIEFLERYDKNLACGFRDTAYLKFITDSSRGIEVDGIQQVEHFLKLYHSIRNKEYLVDFENLITVVKREVPHPVVNVTNRSEISTWVGKAWELYDGAHRLAILKHLGHGTIKCRVLDSSTVFSPPDYTSFIVDKGYSVHNYQARFMCTDMTIDSENLRKLLNRIWKILDSEKQRFGMNGFYQSYRRVKIVGQRLPVEDRLLIYGLKGKLDPSDIVLDIGSNVGFMTLELARSTQEAIGIEPNRRLVKISEEVKSYLGIGNCTFVSCPFEAYTFNGKFTKIFSFASHGWINLSLNEYIERLCGLLLNGGTLFLESHDIQAKDQEFEITLLKSPAIQRFRIERDGFIDDGGIQRKFFVLTKLQ